MLRSLARGYTIERLLMFVGLKRRHKRLLHQTHAVYARVVEAARHEVFYRDWAVRDDKDGRFEMLSLHLFLMLERLRQEPCQDLDDDAALIGQFLSEVAVADLECNLREMGVGDLTVGKRVQKYTKRQYARFLLYRELFCLAEVKDDPVLALIEAIYCHDKGFAPLTAKQGAEHLCQYLTHNLETLAKQPIAEVCRAPKFSFPQP